MLISIIVPIYNVELYLRRCIDSILFQRYKSIEIILVNDGSIDNSGRICDEYALKDTRIKVIHKKNGGVSSARNEGIQVATGDYITFVDSDDWLEIDYFDKVAILLKKHRPVLLKNPYIIDKNNRYYIKIKCTGDILIYNKKKYLTEMIDAKKFEWGPFAAFYRSDICKQISFNKNVVFGEDLLFNYDFIRQSEGIYIYQSIAGYHYFIRSGSATTSYPIYKKQDDLMPFEKIMKNEDDEIKNKILVNNYIPRLIRYTLEGMLSKNRKDNMAAKSCKEKLKQIIYSRQFMQLPLYRQVQAIVCLIPPCIAKKIFLLYKIRYEKSIR